MTRVEHAILGAAPFPPVGVGTWAWGDTRVWGYGKEYGEADVRAAFDAAIDAGARFFDTAELYGWGESERLLGQFMRRDGAPRTDVAVATKFLPVPWRAFQRGSLEKALLGSLERLNLPRVDLYQIHWPLPLTGPTYWTDALADVVQSDLARAVGVSNYGHERMLRTHEALGRRGVPLWSNQVRFSLLDRGPERSGMLASCRELGITLIAYSPLSMGLLSGKYTPANLPRGFRGAGARRRLARVQPLLHAMREIGEAHGGKTPSQVALNWTIAKGALPIPGAKSARQAAENAGAFGWSLDPAEVERLDRVSA